MRILFLLMILPLAACENIAPIEGNQSTSTAEPSTPQTIAPDSRPVRIGEAGPNFAACTTRGTVVNTGGEAMLPVRASPFAEAETTGGLSEGARVIVCTQTIDQRWMGIVIPPAGSESDGECGVAARVSSPRAYEGPCASGWVTSAFVRVSAR